MFDGVKVTIDGGLSVVATLEFFQHDLAKMGHRETSFLGNQTRSATSRTAGPMKRDSVRRTSGLVQVGFEEIAVDLVDLLEAHFSVRHFHISGIVPGRFRPSATIRPVPNAREIIRPTLVKKLLAITNPSGASAQGCARCSYSCARAVASEEPAESRRAAPPVPGRHSGPRFRRSSDTPTLHHKYQAPIRPR